MVVEIKSKEQLDELINSGDNLIVDFYANWCNPCKSLEPILAEVENENSDIFTLCKVNIDENSELSKEYVIRSIPTIFLMKNGQQINTLKGLQPKNVFSNLINENFE